jgi:uncharacterized LabA/DUF88 family protein
VSDDNLKIAVFIDFDNIEIGVKTTLNKEFDVGAVLDAVKERGEVITKVAYGDWKRAGDYSRMLTQHAVRMVQRNMTPGGDKNGADINLALDALEMAFTHDHINAFVIVGGDSDFISLVEKLKQYDRKVFVVGGRQFTAMVLQKNCYEFIAYENVVGITRAPRQQAPQGQGPGQGQGRERQSQSTQQGQQAAPLAKAFPLITRALQVLTDREVTPQLGLLKSTLLQLDSTFSERDYGASSFREFVEKLASAGLVNVRSSGRSLLVDLRDADGQAAPHGDAAPHAANGAALPAEAAETTSGPPAEVSSEAAPVVPAEPVTQVTFVDGLRLLERALQTPGAVTRWPMYIRNVKQVLRSIEPGFDERRYGGLVELLRAGQREGWVRIERDRQGVLRVFQGSHPRQALAPASHEPVEPGIAVVTDTAMPDVADALEPATGASPDESAAPIGIDAGSDVPVSAVAPDAGVPVSDLAPGDELTDAKPRRRRKTVAAGPKTAATRRGRGRSAITKKKKGKDEE